MYPDIRIPSGSITDSRSSDPFFRELDMSLKTEREIRERALGMIEILADRDTAWTVGSGDAQLVEWASAFRILSDSFTRSAAEIARAEKWEVV